MPNKKVIGFYDFHVTADKAKDFFLYNDFSPKELSIYPIKTGDKFDTSAIEPEQATQDTVQAASHKHITTPKEKHTIARFLKHIFHIDKKETGPEGSVESDRDGFILCISSVPPERFELAKQMLHSHGAKYIHDFDD